MVKKVIFSSFDTLPLLPFSVAPFFFFCRPQKWQSIPRSDGSLVDGEWYHSWKGALKNGIAIIDDREYVFSRLALELLEA